MRKILVTLRTGYAGMTSHEAWLVPAHISDDLLDMWALEKAVDHASSYGIYPESEMDEEDEEFEYSYSGENIEGSWRLFEEKDAGKVTYGAKDGISWNNY